jgi:hypothetical protein
MKLAKEKKPRKNIYTHREIVTPLLVQVVPIFEKLKKEKHE